VLDAVKASDEDYILFANNILFAKGKTFYWAKFFLEKNTSYLATRLYSFCRYLDDCADESKDKDHANALLIEIKQSLITGVSSNKIVNDAISLFNECDISVSIPLELINGVMSDLYPVHIQTEDQLIEYCYKVAGTVGLMMCKILQVSNPKALFHAIDLGIAMQLTNICRDIYEDATMGRIYLPASFTNEITSTNIVLRDACYQLTLSKTTLILLEKADQYYESGYCGLAFLPLRSRLSILIAARLYQQIGIKIKRLKFIDFKTRVSVGLNTKLFLTIKALIGLAINTTFWSYKTHHNKKLHQSIKSLPFTNG
jgi:15-cis-phytoene synthase